MPRGWPPLDHRDVLAILAALGFTYSHTRGGHDFYKATRNKQAATVTVSSHIKEFSADLLKYMCDQALSDRKEFYGATERTAKKIR